jgi:hypothetical protein
MEKWKRTILDPVLQNHTLKVNWTYDLETRVWPTEKPIDISKLTLDEQADLIIEKLRAPPKPKRTVEDEIMEIMSQAIADEIDKEILEKLKKGI